MFSLCPICRIFDLFRRSLHRSGLRDLECLILARSFRRIKLLGQGLFDPDDPINQLELFDSVSLAQRRLLRGGYQNACLVIAASNARSAAKFGISGIGFVSNGITESLGKGTFELCFLNKDFVNLKINKSKLITTY